MGRVGLKGGVCESGVFEWFLSFSVGRGVFSCVCFSLPDKKLYLCKVFVACRQWRVLFFL